MGIIWELFKLRMLSSSPKSLQKLAPKKGSYEIGSVGWLWQRGFANGLASGSEDLSMEKLTIQRSQQLIKFNMKLPNDAMMIWRDNETNTKQSSDYCGAGIEHQSDFSILFEYSRPSSSPSQNIMSLRRPLNENFSKTVERLKKKMIGKQKKGNPCADNSATDQQTCVEVDGFNLSDANKQTNMDIFYDERISFIKINDRKYRLIRDAPDCSCLKIDLEPRVGRPLIASYDMRTGYECLSEPAFHWFVGPESLSALPPIERSASKTEVEKYEMAGWSYRHTGWSFVPQEEDVGKRVCVVIGLGPDTIARSAISLDLIADKINEPLIFEKRQSEHFRKRTTNGNIYRIMSYNILADLYLNLDHNQEDLFFPYCPKQYQTYAYRYPLILHEIPRYNADLIFLQEVDERFIKRYLPLTMKQFGYETKYKKKGNLVNEGLAICFDHQKFKVENIYDIWLSELLDVKKYPENEDVVRFLEQNEIFKERFVSRPCVLQLVSLKPASDPSSIILAGNTHLHFDPRHENIKVLQALLCARFISRISRSISKQNPTIVVHRLFAGDFNSTPNSGVYDLLSKGEVKKEHGCWVCAEGISGIDASVDTETSTDRSTLFWSLTSDPPFTNYTKFFRNDGSAAGFEGCLDYIWGDSSVKVISVIPLPEYELMRKYTALPSKICPSDHLPLICDISFN